MNDDVEPTPEEKRFLMNAQTRAAYAEAAKTNPEWFAKAKELGVHTAKIDHQGFAVVQDGDDGGRKPPEAIALPVDPDDEPEEIILQALVEAGLIVPNYSRPEACTVISEALEAVFQKRDSASASREADGMLKLLFLLGACKSREMSFKARVLQALIAKNEKSLSAIGKEFGVTRADVSKVAREMKTFLGLKLGGATRNEAYAEQAKVRAHRVHDFRKEQLRQADEMRKAA